MLDKLKNLSALQKLLTKKNLGYLDILLAILTDKGEDPAFSAFWKVFSRHYPHPDAAREAWGALKELHVYVRKELNKP